MQISIPDITRNLIDYISSQDQGKICKDNVKIFAGEQPRSLKYKVLKKKIEKNY